MVAEIVQVPGYQLPHGLEFENMHIDSTLKKAIEIIIQSVDPDKIILFGSRAKGDNKKDSDYPQFKDIILNFFSKFSVFASILLNLITFCSTI